MSTPDHPGVDVAGPEGNPAIVFVHGAVFQRKMWAPQRNALAGEFRVVAPDLPGHGQRSGTDFRMASALDVLGTVFEEVVDDAAILAGLSLGGYVATLYAQQNPGQVEGLVLSGSSVNPVGRIETVTRAVSKAAELLTRSERVQRKIEERAAEWVHSRPVGPETAEEIIAAGFYPRQFALAGPDLAGRDFRAAFADYPGPALILNGEKDAVMRRGEENHARAARNARVERVDRAGHTCNLDAPEAYTRAVQRFSRESTPGLAAGVD